MFKFRLARQLGRTVRELDQTITSREYAQWIAFERMEPGEPVRGDARMARLCRVMAGLWMKNPPTECDFRLEFGDGEMMTDPDEMERGLKRWFRMLNRNRKGKSK